MACKCRRVSDIGTWDAILTGLGMGAPLAMRGLGSAGVNALWAASNTPLT